MLKQVLEQGREAADVALDRLLPPPTQHPTSIHQAMRHSVFAGGKRLRPILCMEAGRMIRAAFCGDEAEPALSSAEGPRLGGAEPRRHTPCGSEPGGAGLDML